MARATTLLFLCFILAASDTTAVAAQCEEGRDSGSSASSNGCIKCSPDKSRCEVCTDTWVLTATGQCAKCNATHIGGWQESCASCRADDPTICLKCQDYCNTNGCTGYFVTREGHCSQCPKGAAACDDLTGEVRECRSRLGLVGGECRPCEVAGCQKCDGDVWRCNKCEIPRAYFMEGYFPDPVTGACLPCEKGCKVCSGAAECLECALTVLDPVTKTCQPCSVANCFECVEAVDKCRECVKGFRLDEGANTCVPCSVAHCAECKEDTVCNACLPGYGLVDPQGDTYYKSASACHACAKQDPNCGACDGDPAVCSKCADGMAPDPATSLCTPCRQAHARQPYPYCSETDATRCGDGIWDCADGYFCQNVTGQCMSCVHPGCETCSNGTEPGDCTACLPGWWDASRPINEAKYRASPLTNQTERSASFQDVPTECKPCGDPHCLVCDISHGASCERCADGFFLDRKTKLCRSCTEPEGALYETCASAPAPIPAPAAA